MQCSNSNWALRQWNCLARATLKSSSVVMQLPNRRTFNSNYCKDTLKRTLRFQQNGSSQVYW